MFSIAVICCGAMAFLVKFAKTNFILSFVHSYSCDFPVIFTVLDLLDTPCCASLMFKLLHVILDLLVKNAFDGLNVCYFGA